MKKFEETVIPVAAELQKMAEANDEKRKFILVSSNGLEPFILGGYSATTLESEEYLEKECPNLESASIRPGGLILEDINWVE